MIQTILAAATDDGMSGIISLLSGAGGAGVAGLVMYWLIQRIVPKLDEMLKAFNEGKDESIIAMNRVTEVLSTLVLMNELTPGATKERVQKTLTEAQNDSIARRG
jgi:hypothetical protein